MGLHEMQQREKKRRPQDRGNRTGSAPDRRIKSTAKEGFQILGASEPDLSAD